MEATIRYSPHEKQREIHESGARFKVVAAGRRGGKTVLAVIELIRHGVDNPQRPDLPTPRSWYVCETYRQAEMIAWRTFMQYCPANLIRVKNVNKLYVELVNGHIIEFKGSEDYDRLRGVPLTFVVFEEYGFMKPEVWTEVIRPSLTDSGGSALFIGTPGQDGSPHFHDLYNLGLAGSSDFRSWLFFTKDNPYIPAAEIEKARRDMPEDIYKREFEADFTSTSGLIYDNFRHATHVIPLYEPSFDRDKSDFVVGSIDPGLHNPTAAILAAWDKDGVGRIFREYYVEGKLAGENAQAIKAMAERYKVAYWVIDRSSIRRDPATGISFFRKYQELLCPLITAPNDPGSVWAGIDEVKKLFHVDPVLKTPRLLIGVHNYKTLWELGRYSRYKHKWHVEKNEEERPRKLHDHAMDAMRNMVMTRPWLRRHIRVFVSRGLGY